MPFTIDRVVGPLRHSHQAADLTLALDGLADVSVSSPTDTHVLAWVAANSRFELVAPAAGGGGAPTDAQYLTLATNGTLSDERVLTGTANQIVITDNGAGSTAVLSTPQNLHTGANVGFNQIDLPATTTNTLGIVTKAGTPFLHNFKHPTGSTVPPTGGNIFLGLNAGNFTMGSTATSALNGSFNIALGTDAGQNITTGFGNILLGYQTGSALTTGTTNVLAGYRAGAVLTTGSNNVLYGDQAGLSLTTGSGNIVYGSNAGRSMVSTQNNIFMGVDAGRNATGGNLIFFGFRAGWQATTASNSIMFGNEVGASTTTGINNVFIGSLSGYGNIGGSRNAAVGYAAGGYLLDGVSLNTTPQRSVYIGNECRSTGTSTNEIVIGDRALGLGTNTVVLGESITLTALQGKVGIDTRAPTNALSLGGNAARTMWMERHTTSNTAGNNLTVQAGGATVSATDKNGGSLLLAPGASTGTGRSNVRIQGYTRGTTGTATNTLVDRLIVPGAVNLTDAATSMFEVALPAGAMTGGHIFWTIRASDGTDHQAYSGMSIWTAVNKAGVYSTDVTTPSTTDSKSTSSGTISVSFDWLEGTDKVTMQCTPSGSLTETTYQLTYTVTNNSPRAITLL